MPYLTGSVILTNFQGFIFSTMQHLLKAFVVEYFTFAIIKHDLTDIYTDNFFLIKYFLILKCLIFEGGMENAEK